MARGIILKEADTFTRDEDNTHRLKIQLKGQVLVQKIYNCIPKPLHKKIRNMLKICCAEAGLFYQNPTTLHQL